MKKILSIVLGASLLLIMAGCNGAAETEQPSGQGPAKEPPAQEHPEKEQPPMDHPAH